MIKNNLKSKKNKRTKGFDSDNAFKKDEEDETKDLVALDNLKKEINTQLCGGVIIDHDHAMGQDTHNKEALT